MEHELEIARLETMVAEGKRVKTVVTTKDGFVFTCYDFPDSPFLSSDDPMGVLGKSATVAITKDHHLKK